MRKTLFRGTRLDNHEWVYGAYLFSEPLNSHWIFSICEDGSFSYRRVVPGSVGEFTGKYDFSQEGQGKPIFENDILLHEYDGESFLYFVKFDDGAFRFFESYDQKYSTELVDRETIECCNFKVIGNLFECPTLAKSFGGKNGKK